ncbi:MAG: caspase family protein [Alphaproteobacteria bacterium]
MVRLIAAVTALAVFGLVTAAGAATRAALVIGNGSYETIRSLANPVNDAKAMATSLEILGFEVILATDADRAETIAAISNFNRASDGAEIALFYFAGHGIQIDGENYLLPTDVQVENEFSLRASAIEAQRVVAEMERRSEAAIAILDACRNNPIVDKLERSAEAASRSTVVARGLGPMRLSGQGAIVAFAAAAGDTAADGTGEHSPYTAALLAEITEPNIEVGLMFRRVARRVSDATGGDQRPELLVRLFDEVYLNPTGAEAEAVSGAMRVESSETVAHIQPQPDISAFPSEQPQTVQRTATVFPVGKWPEGIAWDGSNLWVAESGQRQLARLDPDNGNVRQRVKVGRLPVGLAATSEGHIYAAVATDKKIWQQPVEGEPGRTLARLQNYPQAIVADEDAVWVLTWVGGSSSQTQVVRIDLTTGQRSHSTILPRNGFDLAVTGDIVWVLHRYDGQDLCELIALDKHSLSEMSRTPFDGFTTFLAATELGVFAAGGEFGKKGLIVKFDPLTGQELTRNENFGIVSSLAVDNDYVIAINDVGVIGVLSAHDLSVIRTIRTTFGEFRSQRVLPLPQSLFITTHQGRGSEGSVIAVDDWRP